MPRWLRQPRHGSRAWYCPFTLASGSDPRHGSRVALTRSPSTRAVMLRDGELDGDGGTRMRWVVRLDERARDHERRLAAEPREPAVALPAEAGLAIDDSGAREVEPCEVVAPRVEDAGDVVLHPAQVLHAVHVAVRVGLAVVPGPRARLDEIRTAVERHERREIGKLSHARGCIAETERRREGRDAAPCRVRVVPGEGVQEAGLCDDRTIRGEDHVATLADEVANRAGVIQRLREERLAMDAQRFPGIDRHVGGGELDVDQGGEDTARVLPVGCTQLAVPGTEVRARRVVDDRRELQRQALGQVRKDDRLAKPGPDDQVGGITQGARHWTATVRAVASRDKRSAVPARRRRPSAQGATVTNTAGPPALASRGV